MDFWTYLRHIEELIDENELSGENPYQIIYKIGDLNVYGQFDEYGTRGVDHNILKFDDVNWEDILQFGTVVVPETRTYISDHSIEEFDNLGYERLPTNNNHIAGTT